MTEKDGPVQYGVQFLVNAGGPSAHWAFDGDFYLRDNAEDALSDRAEAIGYGYAAEHVRVVSIHVIPCESGVLTLPDTDAEIEAIVRDPNAYVAETRALRNPPGKRGDV